MTTHPARAIIDLAALRGNVRALRAAAPDAALMAVVKADAYGHGMLPCARAALQAGATWLGTAQAAEALALRAAGIGSQQARILTWLHAPGAPFEQLLMADIDISVSAIWALNEVCTAAQATGLTARIHIKVDTGLGRNGFMPDQLPDLLGRLCDLSRQGLVEVVGLWTHLAYADEPGHPTIAAQKQLFDAAAAMVDAAGLGPVIKHVANSAATLTAPDLHYDMVRPGLALYGLSPVPQDQPSSALGLTPVMRLEAQLATVKQVPAGYGVSYGHAYVTPQATWLGLVPLGYADGIPRQASGGSAGVGGPVLVGGPASAVQARDVATGPQAAVARPDADADAAVVGGPAGTDTGRTLRIAGRVCMDQFVLDLGPDSTQSAGDTVTLFGASDGLVHGGVLPSAEDWAQAVGTISYEIVTRLAASVPRIYTGVDQ